MSPKSSSFRKILHLISGHSLLLLAGGFFLILGTVVNLAVPGLLREVLNEHGIAFIHSNVTLVALVTAGVFALQSICFYGRSYLFGYLGQKISTELRQSLYESTIQRPIDFFDTSRPADLVARLTTDTVAIQDAISIRLSVLVRYALQVLLGIVLMGIIAWKLTLVVVLVLLVLVGISMMLGKRLRAASRAQQQALSVVSVVAHETFAGARVVKAFDREQSEILRFSSKNEDVLRLGLTRTRISSFFQAFVSFLLNTALALLVLYGIIEVADAQLKAGDLTAFLAYGAIVAVSFSFIASSFAELMQALGAVERVFDVVNLPRILATRSSPVQLPAGRGAEISFEGVGFAYPARLDMPVLSNLSFSVERGTTVALVGQSGAGKSTIVNLMLRFYDPSTGRISLNGVDLRDIDPKDLRRVVSYVPQEPELFGLTIAENLRYGKAEATDEELEVACSRAGILSFIQQLPQGFSTVVGERGAQLSGGQKQRVAIARAMLRDPEVLLLDEATSALDSENEALIQRALKELLTGRTAIVIAHRLSTARGANKVVVLDHGRVVQVGTHDSLSREPGLYRTLVERQELQGAA